MSSNRSDHIDVRGARTAALLALLALAGCTGTGTSTTAGPGTDVSAQPDTGVVQREAAGNVEIPGNPEIRGDQRRIINIPAPPSPAEMFTDATIAATASVSNQSEIVPSQLALQRAQDPQVRDFAQRMAQEHTRLETQMQQLLQQKGVAPMHNAFSYQLDQNLQPMMRELESASGTQFDLLYMDHQVASHMTTLHALETSLIPNARDAEMRTMLQNEVLPTVRQHYQEAIRLRTEISGGAHPGGMPVDSMPRDSMPTDTMPTDTMPTDTMPGRGVR